jgi:hypothetical protein
VEPIWVYSDAHEAPKKQIQYRDAEQHADNPILKYRESISVASATEIEQHNRHA